MTNALEFDDDLNQDSERGILDSFLIKKVFGVVWPGLRNNRSESGVPGSGMTEG